MSFGDVLIALGVAGLLWSGFYAIEHFSELNACELDEDIDHVAGGGDGARLAHLAAAHRR